MFKKSNPGIIKVCFSILILILPFLFTFYFIQNSPEYNEPRNFDVTVINKEHKDDNYIVSFLYEKTEAVFDKKYNLHEYNKYKIDNKYSVEIKPSTVLSETKEFKELADKNFWHTLFLVLSITSIIMLPIFIRILLEGFT